MKQPLKEKLYDPIIYRTISTLSANEITKIAWTYIYQNKNRHDGLHNVRPHPRKQTTSLLTHNKIDHKRNARRLHENKLETREKTPRQQTKASLREGVRILLWKNK